MIIRTFKEWSNKSYKILKGSKAIGFNKNNEALFSSEQVVSVSRAGYDYYTPKSDEWYEGLPEGYYEKKRKKEKQRNEEIDRHNKEYYERHKDLIDSYGGL